MYNKTNPHPSNNNNNININNINNINNNHSYNNNDDTKLTTAATSLCKPCTTSPVCRHVLYKTNGRIAIRPRRERGIVVKNGRSRLVLELSHSKLHGGKLFDSTPHFGEEIANLQTARSERFTAQPFMIIWRRSTCKPSCLWRSWTKNRSGD